MRKLKTILQYNNTYRVIALLVLLYSLAVTLIPNYKSKYEANETEFILNILEYKIDGNKLSLTLKGKEKIKGIYYIKTEEEKEWLEKNLELEGTLKIKGTLKVPNNNTVPNLFNYKKYLYFNKIYYLLEINELKIDKKTDNILYKIKNYAYLRASKIKYNKYIYAYILGTTDNLEENIIDSYRTNGISHLFALSGLHVGIFSLILMKILSKLKIKKVYNYLFIFIILLMFAFITGFSPSILRSILLFFLLGINKIYNLNIRTINILYLTFSIIVLVNPFIIFQIGFILSFITTFFLILTSYLIENKNYLQSLLIVSAISFISSLGVSIYFFGSINPMGIILNLIFVPLVSFIIFPLSLIVYIFPFLSNILNILTNIMENLSLFLTKVKLEIYFPATNISSIIIYYICLTILFKTRNKKIIFIIFFILMSWKVYPYFKNETSIYFIDVGQGDSCLLVTPHASKAILIDTGGKISYNKEKWMRHSKEYQISTDTLIPFMRSIGVYKLDYCFLTHGDTDHAGEIINLQKNFKIDKIYINKGEVNKLESNIQKAKIIDFEAIQIDNIKIQSLNDKIYMDENDDSLVFLLNIENVSIILTGDASTKTEKDILSNYNLSKVDILKVGHHGSKTSSSSDFLETINPSISIISSGLNNRFNHPHQEVLNKLENIGEVYNTAYDGTIEIKIKNGYKVKNYPR